MRTQCTRKSGAWLDSDMMIQSGLIPAVDLERQEQNSRSQAPHEETRETCGKEMVKTRSRL